MSRSAQPGPPAAAVPEVSSGPATPVWDLRAAAPVSSAPASVALPGQPAVGQDQPAVGQSQPAAGQPAAAQPGPLPVSRWSRRARLAGYLGVAAAAVAGSTMIYLVDPAEPGHYPTCPFKWATGGLDCPGCGSMRGLHQVLHGHVGAAADYNLFFVIAAPLLVLGWLVAVGRLLGLPVRTPRVPMVFYRALPVLVAAFWLVRNLPGPVGHWLHS